MLNFEVRTPSHPAHFGYTAATRLLLAGEFLHLFFALLQSLHLLLIEAQQQGLKLPNVGLFFLCDVQHYLADILVVGAGLSGIFYRIEKVRSVSGISKIRIILGVT